jgi:hypothetical protein
MADRRRLKVTPPVGFDAERHAPLVVRYSVSDGLRNADGVLVVSRYPTGNDQSPYTQDDTATVKAGGTVRIPVLDNDVDPEGATLRLASVTAPDAGEGLAFVQGDEVDYVAPGEFAGGMVTFTYVASDAPLGTGGMTNSGQVRVRVLAADTANSAPESMHLTASVIQGSGRVHIDVPLLRADPDGDIVSIGAIKTQPAKGTVDATGDGFWYQPGLGKDAAGTFEFSFSLTDGDAYSTSFVRIGVAAPDGDAKPVATPINMVVKPGDARVVNLLDPTHVTSTSGNLSVSVAKGDRPTLERGTGSLGIVTAQGTVLYTAPRKLGGDGLKLTTSFSYVINDGSGGSARNQVNVTVDPKATPLAPVALDDLVAPVRAGDPVRVEVLKNDRNPQSGTTDGLELTPLDGPKSARWSSGVVTFTMPAHSVRLRYEITDPVTKLKAQAVVHVPQNVGVSCPNGPIKVRANQKRTLDVLADCRPDRSKTHLDSSKVHLDDLAGSAKVQNQQVKLEIAKAQTGTYQLTYVVCIAEKCADTATVISRDVLVEGTNATPTLTTRISVPAGSERTLDLRTRVSDENPGDVERVRFGPVTPKSTEGLTASVTATGLLTVSADSKAYKNGKGGATFEVGLDDGHAQNNKGNGTVAVTVTRSEAAPLTASDDGVVEIVQEEGGMQATKTIDVLGNDRNPSSDGKADMRVVSVTQPADRSGSAEVTHDGKDVTFTLTDPEAFGRKTFTYTVQDPDDSLRRAQATVSLNVIGFPGLPGIPDPEPIQDHPESIDLTWAPVQQPHGAPTLEYKVQCRTDGHGPCRTPEMTPSGEKLAFGPLDGNIKYSFRARARNKAGWGITPNGGWSEWSDWAMTVPAAPTITKVGNFSGNCTGSPPAVSCPSGDDGVGGQLTVYWNPPKDGDRTGLTYQVHVNGVVGCQAIEPARSCTVTATSGSLANGQPSSFWVSATNEGGQNPSSVLGATLVEGTPRSTPAKPLDLQAIAGDGDITIKWNVPKAFRDDQNDTRRSAQYRTDSGSWTTLTWDSGTEIIPNTVNGQNVSIDVRLCNSAGCGTSENVKKASQGRPDGVTGGSVSPGDKSAILTFTQGNVRGRDITDYRITDGSGTNYAYQWISPTPPTRPTTDNSVTLRLTNLANGTSYGPFSVTACNDAKVQTGEPCSDPVDIAGKVIPFGAPSLKLQSATSTEAIWKVDPSQPGVESYSAVCTDSFSAASPMPSANVAGAVITCTYMSGGPRPVSVSVTPFGQNVTGPIGKSSTKLKAGSAPTLSNPRFTLGPACTNLQANGDVGYGFHYTVTVNSKGWEMSDGLGQLTGDLTYWRNGDSTSVGGYHPFWLFDIESSKTEYDGFGGWANGQNGRRDRFFFYAYIDVPGFPRVKTPTIDTTLPAVVGSPPTCP